MSPQGLKKSFSELSQVVHLKIHQPSGRSEMEPQDSLFSRFQTSMLKAFKTKAASGFCDHSLEIDLFPFACLLETVIHLRGVENINFYISYIILKVVPNIASPKNC